MNSRNKKRTQQSTSVSTQHLIQIKEKYPYFTDGISVYYAQSNMFTSSGWLVPYASSDSLTLVDQELDADMLDHRFGSFNTNAVLVVNNEENDSIDGFCPFELRFAPGIYVFQLNDVLLDGFVILSEHYSSFENKVYYESGEIVGVDVNTFKVETGLGHISYAKDKNNVYYNDNKLADADPYTFVLLDEHFSKDKNYVFFRDEKLIGSDPNTFQIISYDYQRDRNHIWTRTRKLTADVATFELLTSNYPGFSAYAKDKDHVYFQGVIIEDADSKTFRLECSDAPYQLYGIDKTNVYYGDRIMEGVDRKTFSVVKDKSDNRSDAYDKNHQYIRNEIIKNDNEN